MLEKRHQLMRNLRCGGAARLGITEENISTLFDLGLTVAEAKTYFCLLQIGVASIREIADVSRVARQDIYRAIIELQKAGMVEKIITIPTKFKPLPIEDALSILMLQRTKESIELNKRINCLIKSLPDRNSKTHSEEDQFVLIHEGDALELKMRKLFETSQNSICFVDPKQRLFSWIVSNYETIENILKRKVDVRIITEQLRDSNVLREIKNLQKFQNFEIRYFVGSPSVWFRIYDGKEILLTTSPKYDSTDHFAVLSNNSTLIELAQKYFTSAWFTAIDSRDQEFKKDRKQFDYLFANMINGFSYNKLIFSDGKPIDFVIIEENAAFAEITGIRRNKLGKRATTILPHFAKELTKLVDNYGMELTSGKPIKFEQYLEKKEKWLSIILYSPENGYFATILEDITERKKAEETLKESEQKHRLISEITTDFVFSCVKLPTEKFVVDWMSGAVEKVTGYTADEIRNKGCWKFIVQPQDLPIFEKNITALEPMQSQICELRITRKDGATRWIKVSSMVTKDSNNSAKHILIGAAEDITELKKAEEDLIASEQHYRQLYNSISETKLSS